MANLVSPGVQVQIIDESFYGSSGPGTVPFIVFATKQDKNQPGSTTSIADGTRAVNANKLYLMTSQRELLQTFGNPIFYTQAGTPQQGNELNEYGLYSAYQYLGIANQAWVIRADVDLSQLEPSSVEPTGEPTNGDLWLDLSNTSWGLFRSNGNVNSSLAWAAVAPTVISSAGQMERFIQGYRVSPRSPLIDPNSACISPAGAGTLVINNVPVALASGKSLNQIVQTINTNTALQSKGIRAEIFARVEKVNSTSYATVYNLRIKIADPTLPLSLDGTVGGYAINLLEDLGFTDNGMATSFPTNNMQPISSIGTLGTLAVNAVAQLDVMGTSTALMTGVQVFEKLAVTTEIGTELKWFTVGSTDAICPGFGWREASATVVTGVNSAPSFNPGDEAQVYIGTTLVSFVNSSSTLSGFANDLNTAFDLANVNALASVYSNGPNSYLRITNYDGTNIALIDSIGSPFENLGFTISQNFYGEVVGADANPTFYGDTFYITVGGIASEAISPTGNVNAAVTAINNDPNLGLTGIITASVMMVGTDAYLKITNNNGTFFSMRNGTGYSYGVAPLMLAGIPTGTTFGNSLVYQGYSVSTPQPRTLDQLSSGNIWINTVASNRGAAWSIKRYNTGLNLWQNKAAPFYMDDDSANSGYGANRIVGSVYVQYNSEITDPSSAYMLAKIWNGTTWQPINTSNMYTQSTSTPTGSPADGRLWYSTNLRVDMMVSDGVQWMGYRNMYPSTDPNGVILSASEPSYQSDGATPLADNDLWIDTSDTENYPKLYRYDSLNSYWQLVDVTDQSSSQGILFADVRPNDDGLSTGSELIQDMLVSNYVDPDAPSALTHPYGFLVFNTRYSTNNVKEWRPNYLTTGSYRDRWVSASGNALNGGPLMGRKAQRIMVVRALASAIVSNQDIRSESNFFNLIATPGYPELIDEMLNLNTDKKDVAFVLVDPPARLTPDGTSIQIWSNNSNNAPSNGEEGLITHSRYAGVYYPWGLATNLDGTEIFVPPSMTVLRTIAFNDQVAYPWFAPAGFNRGMVSAVTSVGYLNMENEYVPVQLSQGQRDVLYSNKMNPIAFIAGRGLVVYGQRTLSPVDSALNRVNVSRLVNYLNYQLDNLAKPFLFEPNDQFTRDSVTRTFESFFGDMVALRAVYDYAVLCDDTNNTPVRIDRNELWIDVAIKPVKAVEFIYIPLRILNTGDPLP
jgi:hypothetical protein